MSTTNATQQEENVCATCAFGFISQAGRDAAGDQPAQPVRMGCRRYPPQTHFMMVLRGNPLSGRPPMPVEEQRSAFPPVQPGWCCGEFQPQPAQPSQLATA